MEENKYPEENLAANNNISESNANPLVIDADIKSFLVETVKWAKFLAILGFVFTGIIALIGLLIMFFGSKFMSQLPVESSTIGGFVGFVYLLLGLIYYFPSRYLYDFCIYIKQALEINDQESLSYGFSKLKSVFRFWGILMVCCLIFYGIIIVFTIGMAVIAGSLAAG